MQVLLWVLWKEENLWQILNNYCWKEILPSWSSFSSKEEIPMNLTSTRLLPPLNYGVSNHHKDIDSHFCCYIPLLKCERRWRNKTGSITNILVWLPFELPSMFTNIFHFWGCKFFKNLENKFGETFPSIRVKMAFEPETSLEQSVRIVDSRCLCWHLRTRFILVQSDSYAENSIINVCRIEKSRSGVNKAIAQDPLKLGHWSEEPHT